ncbi:MAG: hypothetical protein GQ565_08355 [Candidatus Aegiribacteria sp.]|nr:hypothetical protein [Candidatus Aegiribacteria sp.]
MILFPSNFMNSFDISRLLYYAAIWSGGRTSEVRMQGFNALRTHVGEISRSPSSGRVEQLSRQMNLLSGNTDTSVYLPPDVASSCFGACLSEASALLELGYPRDEPALLTTSLPSPARNSIRTRHQIRSAVHHIGGDFELLKTLFRTEDSTDPCLDVTFAVWPPQRVRENRLILRLGYPGQVVPSVLILDDRLLGYTLLCCWDLALRLRDTENISTSEPDFRSFALKIEETSSTRGT